MTSPLLAKARRDGREIVTVTPERAGWTHVGFRALRLTAGNSEALDTGARELCVVVLAGNATTVPLNTTKPGADSPVSTCGATAGASTVPENTMVFAPRLPWKRLVPPNTPVGVAVRCVSFGSISVPL